MNPVFYLLTALGLVGVWFMLRPLWKGIGRSTTHTINKAKETMLDDEKETKE